MRLGRRHASWIVVLVLVSISTALAQKPVTDERPATPPNATAFRDSSEYVLGPGDEVMILAVDADEIANKPVRISAGGDIALPMVGRIHADGMTVQQLQGELADRLKTYIKHPDISINVTQFRSQPVTVIGSVRNPGLIQLEGRKNLLEVLSLAGGVQTESGSKITITRSRQEGSTLPPPFVSADPKSPYSVAEIDLRTIVDASHPELNIQILPHDVISVPRAQIVYAMGQVKKAGGFVLSDKDGISVVQLVARAEGLTSTASQKAAKIIRPVPGAQRIEIDVNLKDIMSGKTKDVILQSEDILFVPESRPKNTLTRTLDAMISMAPGMAVYRIP
jgi:polysaccharide export outer membrane protein